LMHRRYVAAVKSLSRTKQVSIGSVIFNITRTTPNQWFSYF
jgi:hypothetical protein